MIAGDEIQSVLILRQKTCLKMESKALPGHAMSKEWTQSNAQDSSVYNGLQTHSVHLSEDEIVFAFWSFSEK